MKNSATSIRALSLPVFLMLIFVCPAVHGQQTEATVHFKNDKRRRITLEDRAWAKRTEVVDFKTGKTISLGEIGHLDINGSYYEPKSVRFNYLDAKQGISTDKVVSVDTVLLLKKIIGGSVNLYQYLDDQGKEHYFIEKEGAIVELLNRQYKEGSKLYETGEYKGQLGTFTSDCEAVQKEDIQRLSFALYSLRKIIRDYNSKCGHTNYEVPKEPFRVHFGPIIGFAQHRSTFNDSPHNTLTLDYLHQGFGDIESINSFQFGGFVEIPLSRRTKSTSLQFHAFYANQSRFSFGDEEYDFAQSDTIIHRFEFEATYYEIGAGVERKFFSKNPNLSFFVGAGLNFGNTLKVSKNSFAGVRARRPFWYKTFGGRAFPDEGLPKNILIYQFRGGVNYKRFQLGAVFRMGEGGITGYDVEKRKVYGLDVRYRF